MIAAFLIHEGKSTNPPIYIPELCPELLLYGILMLCFKCPHFEKQPLGSDNSTPIPGLLFDCHIKTYRRLYRGPVDGIRKLPLV